jgi:copper oxidase (laccase) domain-containing protein
MKLLMSRYRLKKGDSLNSPNELDRYAGETVVTEQFHIDEVRDLADDNETIEDKTDGNNCKEYACMSEASDKHATEKTQNENSRDSSNELDRYAGATVVTEQFHIDEVRDLADDNETIEDKTDGNNCKEYACMSEASDKHATEKTQNENSRDSSNELDRYAGETVVTEQFHIDEVRDLADDNETIEENIDNINCKEYADDVEPSSDETITDYQSSWENPIAPYSAKGRSTNHEDSRMTRNKAVSRLKCVPSNIMQHGDDSDNSDGRGWSFIISHLN